VGQPKAELLAGLCNTVLEDETNSKGILADLLSAGDKAFEVQKSLGGAAVILDFSASVAVSRFLAHAPDCKARRIAAFLNPTGTDLVVLAEDATRAARLDYLEVVYYREVAANPDLENHLSRGTERLRYARSCRDLTNRVPEDLVGLHSAIASRAIRNVLHRDGPMIQIWRSNSDLGVSITAVPVQPQVEIDTKLWRVITTQEVMDKIRALRAAKLPNETGGVFIGHFDTYASVAYIVDTLPAPPDSKEYPVHYIRGSAGLRSQVEGIKARTATMLHYVGEWHSHPNGYSCMPSSDDQKVFSWLTRWMQIDGYPGLMLIAGETSEAWFVGEMV
jgi:integrative and conjugative element protein (TIGR02256 family)